MVYDGTRECAADVAEAVCKLYAQGKRGTFIFNGLSFELTDVARCSEFVRECVEASYGKGPFALPYWGGTARETEKKLRAAGKWTLGPERGDIVCFDVGNAGQWGHIGLCLGNGLFAENTSSKVRGPGFVVSRLADMARAGRISGYYSVLPARLPVISATTAVLIIEHATGRVLAEVEMVDGGDHIADQAKLYVDKLQMRKDG